MSEPAEPQTLTGGCLCGAVRFSIDGRVSPVGMCHCSKCRKASGAASNAVLTVRKERLTWLGGEESRRSFNLPSGWGTSFCPTCGCPTPQLMSDGSRYWVPAGSLDDDPGPRVSGHIFVGSKASWDVIGDAAPQFDEAPDRP